MAKNPSSKYGVNSPRAARLQEAMSDIEEIDKIFESPGPYSDNFSVQDLSQVGGSSVWKPGVSDDHEATRTVGDFRLNEKDVSFHRSDTFPHMTNIMRPTVRAKGHKERKKDKKENIEERDEDVEDSPRTMKDDDEDTNDQVVQFHIGDAGLEEPDAESINATPILPVIKAVKDSEVVTSEQSDIDEKTLSPLLLPLRVTDLRPCIRSETETASEDEGRRKVQFDIGSEALDKEGKPRMHRKKKRHHRHHRQKHLEEDPQLRRQIGSEIDLAHKDKSFAITTTEDEAKNLMQKELDTISSHRFEASGIFKRHRLRARASAQSIIHPSQEGSIKVMDRQLPVMKKALDRNPHEVFVELADLERNSAGEYEWKETARWIKFEEDVEGENRRWGKPHIAFLDFNSLFSLRKGLERGAVLLDLDERDLPSIAARVVDHMVSCDQIPPEQRDAVVKILLLRHKHIKETQNALRRVSMSVKSGSMMQLMSESADEGASQTGLSREKSITRKGTLPKSISNIFHVGTFKRSPSGMQRVSSQDDEEQANGWSSSGKKLNSRQNSYTQIDLEEGLEVKSREQIEKSSKSSDLMKKIPEGAEATAVLVGAVDFLKTPTIAFVRLAEGVTMENVIEVPIPVRFIFVLLGPFNGEMDYHEVGRSISTLMSDKQFHEVAYRAHSRGQLLSAINEFLNASIVLPPTDFTDKELVPIDEIRAKTQEILKKNENLRAMKKQHELETKHGALNQIRMPDSGDGGDDGPPKRDPLVRHGSPFYGLIQDIKIRYSKYPSDIKDALSSQVLSATIFIFFAALSPAVTFGGMYADQTEKYIGVGETLLVSSINGIIFSLFAAQPLLIVGATGPLMIFDMSLYKFCEGNDLDYLSLRVWVGIWMVIIGLLVTGFEALAIVKKFTRFLEEIFSTLVCIIFIYEAFAKLAHIFMEHPLIGAYDGGCQNSRTQAMGLMKMLSSNDSDAIISPNETDSMMNDTSESIMEEVEMTTIESMMGNDSMMEKGELIKNTAANMLEKMIKEENDDTGPQPNTALLSMCLMLGTFLIAFKLKKFRNSKYLGRGIRRMLGDFGVPISIILMVGLDVLIKDTYTDKLTMPEGLEPSNSEIRGWIINPFGAVKPLPVWCMIAAGPAALLLFILIFIEENICHLILSKPERCLKKGSGFHLDILLSCLINTISGFLGAPFMGPACVRTISHMSALTVVSTNVPPGEPPKIVGCLEQRMSSFVVSLLVGLSVMLYFVLNLVPSAVLLGIFLYMGVSATAGIQLLERVILFFVPVKHHPKVPYCKGVRTAKMHMFTGIQVLILVVLWIVKQSPASLCIPFILLLLIPIRMYLMPFIFTKVELIKLDGANPDAVDNADDELDFYEHMHDLPNQVDTEDDDDNDAQHDKIHKS